MNSKSNQSKCHMCLQSWMCGQICGGEATISLKHLCSCVLESFFLCKKKKCRQFSMSIYRVLFRCCFRPQASLYPPEGKVEPGLQRYPSLLQLSSCDLMEMRVAGTLPSGLYCPLGQNGSEEKPEKRRLVKVEGWVFVCVCACTRMTV